MPLTDIVRGLLHSHVVVGNTSTPTDTPTKFMKNVIHIIDQFGAPEGNPDQWGSRVQNAANWNAHVEGAGKLNFLRLWLEAREPTRITHQIRYNQENTAYAQLVSEGYGRWVQCTQCQWHAIMRTMFEYG